MTGDPTTGTARAPNMHDKIPIPGSERPRPSNSCLVGPVSPEKNIHLNILVRRRPDAPPVPDLAYWQKTPLSERRHVSPEEYREKYGAMQADLKVVSEFLNQHGMRIIEENLGTRTVSVLTTAVQIKSAFNVQLNRYQTVFPSPKSFKLHPSTNEHAEPEPHAHHGFEGSVHVPSHLEGILIAVIGLDDRCLPHGRLGVDPAGAKAIPVETAAALYNFPTTDSSDQTIGIISCQGGYLLSDITTYFSGKTQPTLVDISLLANGVTWTNQGSQVNLITSSNFGQFSPLVETTCDIQVAGTVARGCTINMYFTTNTEMGWQVFLNRILQPQSGERQPTMVSCSWTLELMDDKPIRPGTSIAGLTNFAVLSSLFQDLAFQGINVFTDTG
jgi:kumamolisin